MEPYHYSFLLRLSGGIRPYIEGQAIFTLRIARSASEILDDVRLRRATVGVRNWRYPYLRAITSWSKFSIIAYLSHRVFKSIRRLVSRSVSWCYSYFPVWQKDEHTYDAPVTGFEDEYDCGAANRKSPSGGCAYGMPRYSETPVRLAAGWPETGPLEVCIVAPTCPPTCCWSATTSAIGSNKSSWSRNATCFIFERKKKEIEQGGSQEGHQSDKLNTLDAKSYRGFKHDKDTLDDAEHTHNPVGKMVKPFWKFRVLD